MKKYYSLKLVGGKKGKLKDGSSPVGLVIRKQGKRKIIFLGISAFPEQWNNEFQLYIVDSRKKKIYIQIVKIIITGFPISKNVAIESLRSLKKKELIGR
jgi:hypothetical protein